MFFNYIIVSLNFTRVAKYLLYVFRYQAQSILILIFQLFL